MVKLIDIVNEVKQGELEEINLKKVIATAALAAGLAGTPAAAQAAKEPLPVSQTQQKSDTATTGFGIGKGPTESSAYNMAKIRATADLMQKLGKTELKAGIQVVEKHLFQTKSGYEYEVTVKLTDTIKEGIDDPVKPGILKNRLGKLSCSRVRSAKSKLKNKGTHYAKALQRYLNYHC